MTSSLERQFEHRGMRRGQALLLAPDVALELIAAAHDRRVPVLGVDTFRVTGSSTEPLLQHMADYSRAAEAWVDAASFVRARAEQGFMFEIVLDD